MEDRVLVKDSAAANKQMNGIWEVSQTSNSAMLKLKIKNASAAAYGGSGLDRVFKIKAWDAENSAFVTETFQFEDNGTEATGKEAGGHITIQLNGLSSKEDIRDELQAAISHENSTVRNLVTTQSEEDASEPVLKLAAAAAVGAEPNGSGNGFIEIEVAEDIDQEFQKEDAGSYTQLSNPGAGGFSINPFSGTGQALQLERPEDADTEEELISAAVFVIANDEAYTCISDQIASINTDDIEWVQFTGLGNITAGKGISKNGNTLDIEMLREDDVVSLSSDVHTFASSHSQSYWQEVGLHPMTMVFLNGVLLQQATAAGNVGTAGSADGDYFIQYANSANEIKLDTDLAIDGDKITIIHASMV